MASGCFWTISLPRADPRRYVGMSRIAAQRRELRFADRNLQSARETASDTHNEARTNRRLWRQQHESHRCNSTISAPGIGRSGRSRVSWADLEFSPVEEYCYRSHFDSSKVSMACTVCSGLFSQAVPFWSEVSDG
jgi:hypothetical protein